MKETKVEKPDLFEWTKTLELEETALLEAQVLLKPNANKEATGSIDPRLQDSPLIDAFVAKMPGNPFYQPSMHTKEFQVSRIRNKTTLMQIVLDKLSSQEIRLNALNELKNMALIDQAEYDKLQKEILALT